MVINEYNPHSKIEVAKNKERTHIIFVEKENVFIDNESVDQYMT